MSDVQQLRLTLALAQQRLLAGAAAGVQAAGDQVLATSNQHVPVEGGRLLRSGKVTVDRQTLAAAVSYNTAYAVDAHEDLDLDHDSGRQPKFLENAFNAERPNLGDTVADEVRSEMRR